MAEFVVVKLNDPSSMADILQMFVSKGMFEVSFVNDVAFGQELKSMRKRLADLDERREEAKAEKVETAPVAAPAPPLLVAAPTSPQPKRATRVSTPPPPPKRRRTPERTPLTTPVAQSVPTPTEPTMQERLEQIVSGVAPPAPAGPPSPLPASLAQLAEMHAQSFPDPFAAQLHTFAGFDDSNLPTEPPALPNDLFTSVKSEPVDVAHSLPPVQDHMLDLQLFHHHNQPSSSNSSANSASYALDTDLSLGVHGTKRTPKPVPRRKSTGAVASGGKIDKSKRAKQLSNEDWRCKLCNMRIMGRSVAYSHARTHFEGPGQHRCSGCGITKPRRQAVVRHTMLCVPGAQCESEAPNEEQRAAIRKNLLACFPQMAKSQRDD